MNNKEKIKIFEMTIAQLKEEIEQKKLVINCMEMNISSIKIEEMLKDA